MGLGLVEEGSRDPTCRVGRRDGRALGHALRAGEDTGRKENTRGAKGPPHAGRGKQQGYQTQQTQGVAQSGGVGGVVHPRQQGDGPHTMAQANTGGQGGAGMERDGGQRCVGQCAGVKALRRGLAAHPWGWVAGSAGGVSWGWGCSR